MSRETEGANMGHAVASVVLLRTEDGWRSTEDVVSTWPSADVERAR